MPATYDYGKLILQILLFFSFQSELSFPMTKKPKVIIVGAGILGLASAYHLLQDHPDLDLLVVERLPGPGRGNTARSAAAYRDMFSSRSTAASVKEASPFIIKLETSHSP